MDKAETPPRDVQQEELDMILSMKIFGLLSIVSVRYAYRDDNSGQWFWSDHFDSSKFSTLLSKLHTKGILYL